MRGKIIAAVAAALLTVTAGVIAQTSGFPSRPRFARVVAQGSGASEAQYVAKGTATGATNVAFYQFMDSANNATGYVGDGSNANSDVNLVAFSSGASINLTPGSGGGVRANGVEVMTGRGKGCNIASAGTLTQNLAGCSASARSGVGLYSVDFSPAFVLNYLCVGAVVSASGGFVSVTSKTSSTVTYNVRNASGALADIDHQIFCYYGT